MSKDHKRAVIEAVTILGEAFRQKISETTIRAYELGLADIEPQAIECGLAVALRDSKFMPTIHEFRNFCGCVPAESRATLSWAAAKKAVRDFDYTISVDFDDPVINATIRLMGGWEQFCDTPAGEKFDTWTRKQFEETYIKLCGSINLSEDMTRALPGFHERTNGANGQAMLEKNKTKVVSGLPLLPKRIRARVKETAAVQLLTGIGDMPFTTEGK